jgi:hypothetical protein
VPVFSRAENLPETGRTDPFPALGSKSEANTKPDDPTTTCLCRGCQRLHDGVLGGAGDHRGSARMLANGLEQCWPRGKVRRRASTGMEG